MWVCVKVPARELGIDASLGVPVVEVTSSASDGSYGVGSEITVDIRQEHPNGKFSPFVGSVSDLVCTPGVVHRLRYRQFCNHSAGGQI